MNDKSTVLVLGAGVYQVPLIERANAVGAKTLVASIRGNYPGFDIATEPAFIDTTDAEKLLLLAQDKDVDAVVTACTDVCIPTLGHICDALHLPGVSSHAALLSSNKSEMKKAFKAYGVSTADYSVLQVNVTANDCERVCDAIGYPVIFKAIDSSGSRGIERVTSPAGIESALNNVRSVTRCEVFLIERYLVGTEFGMQAFVQNGEVLFVMLHGDYLFQGATAVPMGHYVPYARGNLNEIAKSEAIKAIKALGIDNCAVNIDAMLCDGKVYIIEVGARAGATCLPELVSIRYGIDYYQCILDCALGNAVSIPDERNTCAYAMILCPANEGTIEEIESVPTIDEHVRFVSLDVHPGDYIRTFKVGPDRIGQIVVEADTPKEAEEALFMAIDSMRIRLSTGDYVSWASPVKN